ncbi:MAG: ATP-binding protein [Kangiellaceae bacterium]|nr:ATP-binding protein [Kangiellaceae bacterium]
MFLRIYGTIFLAMLLAASMSVALYQYSYQERLSNYSDSILKGTLALIAKGHDRQSSSKKDRWLRLISQLTGLNIIVNKNEAIHEKWQLSAAENQIEANLSLKNYVYSVRLDKLSEQQLRAIALLVINELSITKGQSQDAKISQIDQLFPFDIKLTADSNYSGLMDNQQRQIFESGNVVVVESTDFHQKIVLTQLANGKLLQIGPIDNFRTITTELLITLVLINLLLTSLVTYWLVRRLEKRIVLVNQAVSEFGPSNTQIQLPVDGSDIIANLSTKVNDMAARIQELLAHQKEITQAVSHELRTPIARIRFRLELLADDAKSFSKDQFEIVNEKVLGVERDLNQLESLVDEILTLHKLDQDRSQYPISDFDVDPVLHSKVESYSLSYPNLDIKLTSSGDRLVSANPRDLSRLIDNILGNACKHAKSRIQVNLADDLLYTRLTIEDDGAGIPYEDRQRIFKPFVQVKNERNEQINGYGLGLAIVSRIANLNDIDISIDDSHLGGAAFHIDCVKPSHPLWEGIV